MKFSQFMRDLYKSESMKLYCRINIEFTYFKGKKDIYVYNKCIIII